MEQLQLSYEITTPGAIYLFLKSLDVTIPNYFIITQFRHYFCQASLRAESHKEDDVEIIMSLKIVKTMETNSKADDDSRPKEDDEQQFRTERQSIIQVKKKLIVM